MDPKGDGTGGQGVVSLGGEAGVLLVPSVVGEEVEVGEVEEGEMEAGAEITGLVEAAKGDVGEEVMEEEEGEGEVVMEDAETSKEKEKVDYCVSLYIFEFCLPFDLKF